MSAPAPTPLPDHDVDALVDDLLSRSLPDAEVDRLADDVCDRVMHVLRAEAAEAPSMSIDQAPATPRRSRPAALAIAAGLSAGVTLLIAWSAGVTAKSNLVAEVPVDPVPQIAVMGPGDILDQEPAKPDALLVVGLPLDIVRDAAADIDSEVVAFSGIEAFTTPATEAKAAAGVTSEASPFSTYASTLRTKTVDAQRRHVVAATDPREVLPGDLTPSASATK
ncbi:MAG: hypothetical protein AAF561_10130 [Planctomycetota bacterium]